MTLGQARQAIGCSVIYNPGYGPREDGVIVRVSEQYVFVRYRGNETPKATLPSDLYLVSPSSADNTQDLSGVAS